MKLFKYILFLFITCLVFQLDGQSKKAYVAAAENAFYEQDYYSAMEFYRTALEFDEDQTDLLYRYAQSAEKFDAYKLADSLFLAVYEKEADTYPLSSFYVAEMKQKQGDYESAIEYYKLYLSLHEGESEYHTSKAQKELEACEWAVDRIENSNQKSEIVSLGDEVNTEFSEFGAVEIGDSLYFSSLRFPDNEGPFDPDRLLSKILIKEEVGYANPVSSEINRSNGIVAHSAFNEDQSLMFYTICKYQTASEIICDLYYTEVGDNGEFAVPGTKLPDHINSAEFTETQPMVYNDVLYFVSDRTDGQGNLDIWSTEFNRASMNFSEPVNLESINTDYNEITPFHNKHDDHLYFSSDGYIGFGGYDVYKSKYSINDFGQPENIGHPVNSSYNDIYYYLGDSGNVYLSSNRSGSKYIESKSEACCYDIYKLDMSDAIDIQLDAQTFDAITLDSLLGAKVILVDTKSGEVLDSIINLDGASHLFDLEWNTDYTVIAEKEGYYPDTISLSTFGINQDTLIIKKLFLERDVIELELTIFDGMTLDELEGATVTIENLDNPGEPIVITNFNANDFKTELNRNTRYRITVTKDGYESSTFLLDTLEFEGDDKISKKIYLKKKATTLNDYLPLSLYFDNDIPNKKSWKRTTEKTYTETYYPYINRRDEFKEKYTRENGDQDDILSEKRIDEFFTNDLEYGYNRLQEFLNVLYGRLNAGEKVTIVINGYASPKYKSSYNKRLSERRINSVKNELKRFKFGLLAPFIDEDQLVIREVSLGEEVAPSSVSDSQQDVRNSVFSPEASRERKAEVLKIESSNNFN